MLYLRRKIDVKEITKKLNEVCIMCKKLKKFTTKSLLNFWILKVYLSTNELKVMTVLNCF